MDIKSKDDSPSIDFESISYALRNPGSVPYYIRNQIRMEWHRWRADSWEEYYIRMTKQSEDPEKWVGPADSFEDMQKWQTDLMLDLGLKSNQTIIDLGCGILRGGIPLIEYLDIDNYYGMDITLKALLEGHRRIHKNGLEMKKPTLIHNSDLRFRELQGIKANWLLAQSVWTHLPPENLEQCLNNMGRALSPNATIVATIHETKSSEPEMIGSVDRINIDFAYSLDWIRKTAGEKYSVDHLDVSHPNEQEVIKLTYLP